MSPCADIPAVTTRERWIAWLIAFVGVPMLTLAVCGPPLFDRPFWADETLSWLISSDRDATHAMGALAGGIDTNAPLIHVMYRLVGDVLGHTPAAYRSVSAIFLCLSLAGLYLTLRQTLRAGPAIVGCLAFWALPIVVAHQTETRFYGPMAAAAIWTCYFIGRRRNGTDVATAIGLAIASAILCATHYFGIIALGGLLFVELLVVGAFRRSCGQLMPTLAGLVTTLCLWPLLKTQRAALASVGGTWLPDDFWMNLTTTLRMLVPPLPFLVFVAMTVVALLIAGRRRTAQAIAAAGRSPLAGLALFLVAMIGFDRLVQPVLVPRYLMPTVPAIALLIAALASTLPRRAVGVAGVVMLGLVGADLVHVRAALADPQPRTALALIRSVEHVPARVPIYVDWRGHLLPIWAARPDLRDRIWFVDDPRCTHPDLTQAIPFERRMIDIMDQFYAFPRITPLTRVSACEHFVLVTEFPESIDERFAGWTKRAMGPLTFELSRASVADAK